MTYNVFGGMLNLTQSINHYVDYLISLTHLCFIAFCHL